jgi:hypothetical protein
LPRQVELVHLDQGLSLAAAAVDVLVELPVLCLERGNDVAGIEAADGGVRLFGAGNPK